MSKTKKADRVEGVEPQKKTLQTASIVELKAEAFDIQQTIKGWQQKLNIVHEELQKRFDEQKKNQEKPKAD